jgi:phospholipid/cholesterol/gamma-HCH transport system substrate-binding protein
VLLENLSNASTPLIPIPGVGQQAPPAAEQQPLLPVPTLPELPELPDTGLGGLTGLLGTLLGGGG